VHLLRYFIVCSSLLLSLGCKKGNDTVEPPDGKYYFKCTVDTFNIDEKLKSGYMNRISLKSIKQGLTTYFQFSNTNELPNGIAYLNGQFQILDIGEGEFLAREFDLKIGKHINSAGTYSDTKTHEFIDVVIEEYTFGTYDKPGIVAGTFSGVVTHSLDPDPYKTFPISGSFSFPAR
jgi:hypothetical protein